MRIDRRFLRVGSALPALACVAIATGCAGGVSRAGARPAATTAVAEATHAFTRVTLERRPCSGTCPVYVVSIFGDGSEIFEGRAHADSVGRFTFHLAADRIAELARLVDSPRFTALGDRYVHGASACGLYAADAPIVVVAVIRSAGSKTVEHDAGCTNAPRDLVALERELDELIGTARWVGRGR